MREMRLNWPAELVLSNASKFSFKRVIHKENGTNARAMEITEQNIEGARKIWRKPEAEIGDFLVRVNTGHVYLRSPAAFHKAYRLPF